MTNNAIKSTVDGIRSHLPFFGNSIDDYTDEETEQAVVELGRIITRDFGVTAQEATRTISEVSKSISVYAVGEAE